MDQLFGEEKAAQEVEEEKHESIFYAAEQGNMRLVKSLLAHKVHPNVFDTDGNVAIDYAWMGKHFEIVLLLLQADSKFPKDFKINLLRDEVESERSLKKFVQDINLLHKFIEDDHLEKVEELTKKRKTQFYLNVKNASALTTALIHKKFTIYAFLESISATFFNENEKKGLNHLEYKDKVALREARIVFFSPMPSSHINYLISKSKFKSQKSAFALSDRIQHFYLEIDKIPEASLILQAIQFADFLEITFDFDEEHVEGLNPFSSKGTKGETMYKEGRLYIAASPRRGERKILGTLIHEITHMAIELLFKNECNPYYKTDRDKEERFEEIRKGILKGLKDTASDIPKALSDAIKLYEKQNHPSELIVRVPQILVEFENGREWLKEYVPDLYNFFTEIIVPKIDEYTTQSPTIRTKKLIRRINESLGEVLKLKQFNIFFLDNKRKNLLCNVKTNVVVFETECIFLATVKILQGMFGKCYLDNYDSYLLLNFENLLIDWKEVLQDFSAASACNTLIIQFDGKYLNELKLNDLVSYMSVIIQNLDKKVILIIKLDVVEKIHEVLNNVDILYKNFNNERLSLNHIDPHSKNKILMTEIILQEQKISLKKLIGKNDEYLDELITGETIDDLVRGIKIKIGSKLHDQSTLENFDDYDEEEINLKAFISEFKKSDDIFIFTGLEGQNKKELLIACFKECILEKIIDRNCIAKEIENINFETCKPSRKRLLIAEAFSDAGIKKFCQQNSKNKIYYIKVKNNSRLILLEVGNTDFYIERQFKIIVLYYYMLNSLISKCKDEIYILSSSSGFLYKSEFKNYYENFKEAETYFKRFSRKQTVHWFHAHELNKIFWMKSSGSIHNIRTALKEYEQIIGEKDIAQQLVYRPAFIISDNSGMGKSTTLSKLYKTDLISKTHWVFRINLREHLEVMKNKNIDFYNLDDLKLILLLQNMKIKFRSKLEKNLFSSILNPKITFETRLLFVFDGFDELVEEGHREKVIFLLQYLQEKTTSKIWITTRVHHKALLEEKLLTPASSFDPLNNQQKKIFIRKFLGDRLKLVFDPEVTSKMLDNDEENNSEMLIYTENFLESMKNIFKEDHSMFIGTPLQLKLLLENSVTDFKTWVKNGGHLDFLDFGKNIFEVYKKFINRKYDIYFKKQNILTNVTKKREKKNIKRYHKLLAESQTRNLHKDGELQNPERIQSLLVIGLLKETREKNIEFIHLTFKDFFCSIGFLRIHDKGNKRSIRFRE